MSYSFCDQLYEIERPKTLAEQREIDAELGRAAAVLSDLVVRPVRWLALLRSHRPIRTATGEVRPGQDMIAGSAR